MADPFDTADFYDACNSDYYHHENVAEALEECTENWGGIESSDVPWPIEVVAYAREECDETWWSMESLRAAELIIDEWVDQFGNPEERPFGPAEEALAADIAVVLAKHFGPGSKFPVWQCRQVARRKYTREEAAVELASLRTEGAA